MQGGPRRGRSPITGPTLPCAAQASQTSPTGERSRPEGGNTLSAGLITWEENPSFVVSGEPVRRIYANPPFLVWRRQKLFLMLTYLSTLRLKKCFFLARPEKYVFCKFPQHQPSPRSAPASQRKATPQPASAAGLVKANGSNIVVSSSDLVHSLRGVLSATMLCSA